MNSRSCSAPGSRSTRRRPSAAGSAPRRAGCGGWSTRSPSCWPGCGSSPGWSWCGWWTCARCQRETCTTNTSAADTGPLSKGNLHHKYFCCWHWPVVKRKPAPQILLLLTPARCQKETCTTNTSAADTGPLSKGNLHHKYFCCWHRRIFTSVSPQNTSTTDIYLRLSPEYKYNRCLPTAVTMVTPRLFPEYKYNSSNDDPLWSRSSPDELQTPPSGNWQTTDHDD